MDPSRTGAHGAADARWRRVVPVLWCLGLALLALGPALRPGFVLRADMVFVPRQVSLPAWWGLGPGLPRAVPQDGLVALASSILPGDLLQALVLVITLAGAGLGASRLLAAERMGVRLVAATAYVWTPYVAERLLLGNWGLLVAYAVLPWALVVAGQVRRGVRGALALVPLLALAALTPTGGVLVAAVAVPVAVVGGRLRVAGRALVAGAAVLANAPWWVPALLNPYAVPGDGTGAEVFALRTEGGHGAVLTALGTGGVWNGLSVPASRATLLAPFGTLLLLALAALGARAILPSLGRACAGSLGVASAVGIAWCLAGAWSATSGATAWVVTHVPGAGLLRDAQKFLMPWALLLALAVALGLGRLAASAVRRSRDRAVGPVVAVGGCLLVVLLLPDLALGAAGRLTSTTYPAGWEAVRTAVASDARTGDVLVLPWSTYRAFSWNDGTPMLDPAPRYLTRTSVVSDDLVVRHGDAIVTVVGEDPRSAQVGAALRSGTLTAARLAGWGIGLVLVETDQPGPSVGSVSGLDPVPLPPEAAGAHLALYAVPGAVGPDPWAASTARTLAVAGVDLAAAGVVLAALVMIGRDARLGRASLLHSRHLPTEE